MTKQDASGHHPEHPPHVTHPGGSSSLHQPTNVGGSHASPTPRATGSPGALGAPGDSHSLAIHLEPILREACEGRLGRVEWFNAAWQHGGAATGFASWDDPHALSDQAGHHPIRSVLVKLPVGPTELRWTCDLGHRSHPGPVVPRVLASGDSIGGIDLGWLVVERLEGAILAKAFDERSVRDLLAAAVQFQQAAAEIRPPDSALPHEAPKLHDWHENIARAKEAVRLSKLPDQLRWLDAIKHVQKSLSLIVSRWNTRPINAWCHGDLHPGNALRRRPQIPTQSDQSDPCVLIDLALVHAGHWVEDAVYLERQYWGHAELLHGLKPLAEFSRLRRQAGLPVDTHATDVAIARRLLMASVVPLFLGREHNAKYVRGALEVIEKYLPQLH